VNKNIYSKSGNLIAIFDVENKIDDLDKYEKVLIINQHGIRFKFAEDAVVMVLLAGEIEQSFKQYFSDEGKNKSGLDIVRLFEDFRMILEMPYMLIVIFLAMVFFVKNIFSALAYSFVVGIMIVTVCKNGIFEFRQCFRIAAFTATPVVLLDMLSNMLGGGLFSYTSLVYFITHMLYIHFAVESYKRFRNQN
jgi:hypothetical protein